MKFAFDLISFGLGILAGGAATAASTKLFGWFSKQDASIAKKVP